MIKPPSATSHFAFYPELVERSDVEFNLLIDQLSLNPDRLMQIHQFLTGLLLTIRFNTLIDLDEVGTLWERIREDEYVTDLVLDHTTALRVHADTLQPQGWNQLVQVLADAWGVFHVAGTLEENSVIQFAKEAERFLHTAKAEALIKGNPWLVSLHFMRMTQYTRELLKAAGATAAARWAAAQQGEGES